MKRERGGSARAAGASASLAQVSSAVDELVRDLSLANVSAKVDRFDSAIRDTIVANCGEFLLLTEDAALAKVVRSELERAKQAVADALLGDDDDEAKAWNRHRLSVLRRVVPLSGETREVLSAQRCIHDLAHFERSVRSRKHSGKKP